MSAPSTARVPRAILRVMFGPQAGSRLVLVPGETASIGRAERATFSVPKDTRMSGIHAEVTWDGDALRVRDQQSQVGTFVGGELVREAFVSDGGWLQLGDTTLLMHVEALDRGAQRANLAKSHEDAVLAALSAKVGSLYAVVDAARDEDVLRLLAKAVDPWQSLYEGVRGEALADVAPYLVQIDASSPFLSRLIRRGFGEAFGIFLTSTKPFVAVRRHLRRFLMVLAGDTNNQLYFRYYDPRVLREALAIFTPRQEDDVFDQLVSFICEGEDQSLFEHGRDRRKKPLVLAPATGGNLAAHP